MLKNFLYNALEVIILPIYNAPLLKIDVEETRRYAGLRKAENFDDKTISDVCEDALLFLDVRGVWKVYDYDCKKNLVLSEPTFEIKGESIIKHLADCEKVVCMAVTVGEKIEREITAEFRKGGYVYSMILDAAATAAVEQAADAMEKIISLEAAKESYKNLWRYSPGYGDWALTEQKKFFQITDAKEIGMRLSPAMMLMPRKSVTAIIGLKKITATENNSSHGKNSCATCEQKNCPAKKD